MGMMDLVYTFTSHAPTGEMVPGASIPSKEQENAFSMTDMVDKLPNDIERCDTLNNNETAQEYDDQLLYLSPTAYETVIGLGDEDFERGDNGDQEDCTCYIRVEERPKGEEQERRLTRPRKTREKMPSKPQMRPTTPRKESSDSPSSTSSSSESSTKSETMPIKNIEFPREAGERRSNDKNRRRSTQRTGRKTPTSSTSSKDKKKSIRVKDEVRDPCPQERPQTLRTMLMKPLSTNLNRNGRSKQDMRQKRKQPVRHSSRQQPVKTPRQSRGRSQNRQATTRVRSSKLHTSTKRKSSPSKRHQQRKPTVNATKRHPTKPRKDIAITKKKNQSMHIKTKQITSKESKKRVSATVSSDKPIVHSRNVIALPRYYVEAGDSHASDSTPMEEAERKFMRDKFHVENE